MVFTIRTRLAASIVVVVLAMGVISTVVGARLFGGALVNQAQRSVESDLGTAFLLYGDRRSTVRLGLHPLAYWILTTDKEDQDFLARAAARNPALDRLALLRELAARYPHGVVGQGRPARPAA